MLLEYCDLFEIFYIGSLLVFQIGNGISSKSRSKRYLLTPPDTQWGVFVTMSIPLHPDTTTSVAWFFEANYYTVANSTYWYPLLGDVTISRSREERSSGLRRILSRKLLYESIESMLQRYGFPGRPCLLRSICSASVTHFHHNGLFGDLIHLVLTPSSSMEEENLEYCYYEAEFLGRYDQCSRYVQECPYDPLEYISVKINKGMF